MNSNFFFTVNSSLLPERFFFLRCRTTASSPLRLSQRESLRSFVRPRSRPQKTCGRTVPARPPGRVSAVSLRGGKIFSFETREKGPLSPTEAALGRATKIGKIFGAGLPSEADSNRCLSSSSIWHTNGLFFLSKDAVGKPVFLAFSSCRNICRPNVRRSGRGGL